MQQHQISVCFDNNCLGHSVNFVSQKPKYKEKKQLMLNIEVWRKKESTEFWLILIKFQILQQTKSLENVTRIYHMLPKFITRSNMNQIRPASWSNKCQQVLRCVKYITKRDKKMLLTNMGVR